MSSSSSEDATRAFCLHHDGTGNHLSVMYVDGTLSTGQVVDGRFVNQATGMDADLPRDGQTSRITAFSPSRNTNVGVWIDPTSVAAAQLFRLPQEAQAERASLANEASRASNERAQAAGERQQLADEVARGAAERADMQSRLDNAALAFDLASQERARSQAQLDAAQEEIRRGQAERATLQQQVAAATAAANTASQQAAHAASTSASLQQQVDIAASAADAATKQAAHVISATASHRIQLEERMASVEQASRAHSRAASPDASNPAIARAQAAYEHARQQSEAASLRVSDIERASAHDRSRLDALEGLPARVNEMHHALMELSATMGTMAKTLGGRSNPIDVSSSSASFQQQPSSFQQQQVPVSFVSSASTNDHSTIMLQRLCETGSEVVGTASAPYGVLDPFLPSATVAAINTLPNHYRWARKGNMGEKLRAALADMATWINGPEQSAASSTPEAPRARAAKWLADNHVRLSTAEWLLFREGPLQAALELVVSRKRNNPDLFPILLAARHPKSDVTALAEYASGSALLNGDELWAGNKARAEKKIDKADQGRADRAAPTDTAGPKKGGRTKRAIS